MVKYAVCAVVKAVAAAIQIQVIDHFVLYDLMKELSGSQWIDDGDVSPKFIPRLEAFCIDLWGLRIVRIFNGGK